jgi:hypothetical protein
MISTSPGLRERVACAQRYQVPYSVFLRWDEGDQDTALAYERYLAGLCPQCRTPRHDWEHDRFAYVADIDQCPGCETVSQAQRQLQDQLPEGEASKGYYVALVPREIYEAREVAD